MFMFVSSILWFPMREKVIMYFSIYGVSKRKEILQKYIFSNVAFVGYFLSFSVLIGLFKLFRVML